MRIGLVGTGHWARSVHGDGAVAHPDWELVSVWGRDATKAGEAAAALGCTSTTAFDELLSSVDAVVFAVPPAVQAPMALEAARAGKHLLLEKPVDLDVARAEELAAAVEDAGVAALVFLTRLWSPRTAAWIADTRATGGWRSGRAAFVAALSDDFLETSPWRREEGALWDVGPHALSVLEAVLGPVADVQAVRGEQDHVVLLLRHDSGAVSTADLTLRARAAAMHTHVGFWGDHGISEPMPDIKAADGRAEVLASAHAALSSLHTAAMTGEPPASASLAQGVHITKVLATAETQLG
jgi:predicted dehydrogenase